MKVTQVSEELMTYMEAHCQVVSPVLAELGRETATMAGAIMQISPMQGSFMHLLAKLVGARRCIEIGCFTGYSAISVASALPEDGKLVSFDINAETSQIARRYFEKAGLSPKIDLRVMPALEGLEQLAKEWGHSSVDFVFIDADKGNQARYYEACLELLRPGGLIIADNVLMHGGILNPRDQKADVVAMRAFNEHVKGDTRVDRVMINVADGLFLARKK